MHDLIEFLPPHPYSYTTANNVRSSLNLQHSRFISTYTKSWLVCNNTTRKKNKFPYKFSILPGNFSVVIAGDGNQTRVRNKSFCSIIILVTLRLMLSFWCVHFFIWFWIKFNILLLRSSKTWLKVILGWCWVFLFRKWNPFLNKNDLRWGVHY